jgi:hypothetical protein
MASRLAKRLCRHVARLALSAMIIASLSDVLAESAPTPGAQSEQRQHATTLSPILKAVLTEALAREKEEMQSAPDRLWRRASFPLPVCLFEHGLCGALNRDGSIAVPPRYDFLDDFHEGRAVVRSAGLYGFVDTDGRVTVEPQYAIAGQYRLGLAEVDIDGKSALIDLSGRHVLGPRFARAVPFNKEVFWVNDGVREYRGPPGSEVLHESEFRSGSTQNVFVRGRWGLLDKNGTWIRPPEFQDIARFDPENIHLMWAQASTGWGLIRPDGTWALEPTFQYKHALSDGLAAVWRDGKLGYIDRSGAIAIPPKFDIDPGWTEFVAGLPAPAKRGRSVGLIDRSGNWVIEPAYDRIFPTFGRRPASGPIHEFKGFKAKRGDKSALLDASGNVIIDLMIEQEKMPPPRRDGRGTVFSMSLYILPTICPDGRMGLIDQKTRFFTQDGKSIELDQGQLLGLSCDAPHVFKLGEKFGYADRDLRQTIEPRFEIARPFRDGLATVKIDGKYGLIREDGTWALEAAFDAAQALQGNLALVKVGNHASLINITTGALVVPTQFDEACSLGRGIVGVVVRGKMGAIDQRGNWLFEPNYEPLRFGYAESFTPVQSRGKWGFLDWMGNAIEAKFDEVSRFERGVAWVKSDGEWCPIDRRGNKVPILHCQSEPPKLIERPRPEDKISCQVPR